MNTCDTCKHWESRTDSYPSECQFLEKIRNKEDAKMIGIIIVGSLDDDRNHVYTAPQFGCRHWEDKA